MQELEIALSLDSNVQHLHRSLPIEPLVRLVVCQVESLWVKKYDSEAIDPAPTRGVLLFQPRQDLALPPESLGVFGEGFVKLQKELLFKPEQLRGYLLHEQGLFQAVWLLNGVQVRHGKLQVQPRKVGALRTVSLCLHGTEENQ